MPLPTDPPLKALASSDAGGASRRMLLLAPVLAGFVQLVGSGSAEASPIDPSETTVTRPNAIHYVPWSGGPRGSGEVATLYGGLDKPGPYLVLMKWNPGYFSAPHTYATDRLSVVISGTWWVNSGADFDPAHAVAVPAGSFVLRHAHTPHYDGVVSHVREPAVIALFGIAPVDLHLVDPSKPAWRRA